MYQPCLRYMLSAVVGQCLAERHVSIATVSVALGSRIRYILKLRRDNMSCTPQSTTPRTIFTDKERWLLDLDLLVTSPVHNRSVSRILTWASLRHPIPTRTLQPILPQSWPRPNPYCAAHTTQPPPIMPQSHLTPQRPSPNHSHGRMS